MPGSPPAPDPNEAVACARRLADGLDPRLRYHDARHTFAEVVPAVRALAHAAGVGPDVRDLLVVAAAFHDLGFLALPDGARAHDLAPVRGTDGCGHERVGAALMRRTLAPLGYGDAALDRIERTILATRLGHRPTTLEERLLSDADLALLGSRAFPIRNEDLRLERAALGVAPVRRAVWARTQADFLLRHRFASEVAERAYGPERARNERLLRSYARTGRRPVAGRTSLSGGAERD